MSEPLAQNSVKSYRPTPDGFEAIRGKLILLQNLIFVGVLGLFVAMDFKSADRDWMQGSLRSLWPHLFALSFVCAVFFFSFRRAIKKHRENWLSYEIMLGDDFIIRRMTGLREMEIRREEITAIRQSKQGLIIETNSKQRAVAVASTLVEFDEVRSRLSEWMTPTEVAQAGWKRSPYLLYGLVVAELVCFGIHFLATRSWLLVCSGVPLFVGLVWALVLLQKNAQLAPKTKRTMWIIVFPLIAIASRLVDAIVRWR